MYENENVPIVNGCECGSRLFLFIKHQDDIKRAEQYKAELEKKIEQIDIERKEAAAAEPKAHAHRKSRPKSKFGVETIRVHDIGIYSIHLDALMKGAPIVVLSKGGSYIISFPSLFEETEKMELPLK